MMGRSVYDVQRDFAISSGLRTEIIWDSLSADQSDILRQKLAALVPDDKKAKLRARLFESIWSQRKYTNRNLLSSIIYVMVVPQAKSDAEALASTQFSCHPVVRTRKCVRDDGSSSGCCMIFIDECGRVYQNWQEYVDNNVLPRGTMISPTNGVYMFDEDNEILLEIRLTPQSRGKSRFLRTTDTVATAGSVAATVPIVAAMAVPVAAPIMAAVAVVGVSTAAYTTVRSALALRDRRQHGQTMSIRDVEARSSWLGMASGVVGLGSAGATKAVSFAAAAGKEIALGAQLVVQGINVSSIVLSGTGMVNGVYELYMKYSDDEAISSLNVLQLASSLLVFTHSINNYRLASKAVSLSQGRQLRSMLSREIRDALDKVCTKTHQSSRAIGTTGTATPTSASHFDVLRIVNDIPFREVLLQLPQVANSGLQPLAMSALHVANALPNAILTLAGCEAVEADLFRLTQEYGAKFVQHIGNVGSLNDVLTAMVGFLRPRALEFLMRLATIFIDESLDGIDHLLNTYISTETVLYKMLMQCVHNYKDFSYEFLHSRTGQILRDVEEYFVALNPNDPLGQRFQCKQCGGGYTVCDL